MTTTVSTSRVLQPQRFKPPSISDRLTSLLNRLQPSSEVLAIASALLIGGGSGLAIVLFKYSIELCQSLTFKTLMGQMLVWGSWTLAFIPILGGLVVGFLRWRFPDFLGQEFSALLSSTRVQKISPLRPAIKLLAAAVSLGTGASLGPEGPSVELGSNIGILLGQSFQVSKDRYRLLIGAGAAAGLAAGFNAPIAGVFFALEVVLGTAFTTPAASLILLSAVISALIAQTLLGIHPAFELPVYQVLSHWEWIYYVGLGLLASVVSTIYTQAIKLVQACFQGEVVGFAWLGKLPKALHPVVGGACIGVIALQLPQILGIGYGVLEAILCGDRFPLSLLGVLLVAKLIATSISLGSGLVGGVFAPAMFLGACLGAIYGNCLLAILPPELSEIAPPPAYAMVGMAAVLAGSVKAPLTSILLLFELTQNYLIVLPLMAAVGVSVWGVELFKSSQAIQGLNLQQMGVNLQPQNEFEVLQQVSIAVVMERSYLALPASMSLLQAGKTMLQNKCHTALVLDETEQLLGIVTLADIRRAVVQTASESHQKNEITQTLNDICTAEVLYAYEDEPVLEALERMGARGLYLLPVVARDNPRKVLGVIEQHRIALASNLAMTEAALQPYLANS
ncbi:chloride channel protein [Chroococcidiopsis sp. TS-821]|uniref:chloride channel protein n=1 Tax=Chroococcidiopsis sp. TS-821 TaxID=1378066 RepID=UPI000CEE31EA|nr:chloride channel protein [Chroococcidiopsis sp. TS-821]PPS42830.1 chloride channel protein [Chroococcidiopsis sp. TS-821]